MLPIAVESISFPLNEYYIEENTEYSLTLNIYPQNADNSEVIWSSDNPTIASIDKEGKLYAQAQGETIIKAQTIDGKHSANCKVHIVDVSYFVSIAIGGHTFVNGYIIGDITVNLTNNSSKNIYPTSLTIISTNDNSHSIDNKKIPEVIQSGETIYVKYAINAYRPIFLLEYLCEDNPYSSAYMPYFPTK